MATNTKQKHFLFATSTFTSMTCSCTLGGEREQWKTLKAYISTKSEVLRDEQGLYKLKDDYYTNSMMKEKVLGEYKRGGSEKQRGAIQYNKVHLLFHTDH